MPYTWTIQIHDATAARNPVQLETWVHMARGWELIDIMQVDTLDKAYEVAKSIRADREHMEAYNYPVIIAAVRFAPCEHHRLATWYGTYNAGDTNA